LVDNGQNVTVNGIVVNFRSPELNRMYWDLNGATAGAGGLILSGTWDSTTANFNTSSAGTNAASAWMAGRVAMFAAGSDGGGTYTVTVSGSQSIGGLDFQTGSVTLQGGGFALASDSTITAASGTQTINTPISGAFAILKDGAGTVIFGGANTYTGITSIEAGVLQLGTALALRNTNVDVNVDNGLNVNGFNATLGGLSGSGNVNLGSQTLTVGYDNQNAEYAGVLSGTGQITKLGLGIWTLDAANTFSGGMVISGGEVSVSADTGLGAAGGSISLNGGTLQVTGTTFNSTPRTISMTSFGGGFDITDPNNTFTVSQNLSGGLLSKLGAGTLVLSGTNTQSGLTLNGGTVSAASAANLGSGAIKFAATSTLNITGSQAVVIADPVTVSAASTINVADLAGVTLSNSLAMNATLVKTGEGALTLAGIASGNQSVDLRNGSLVAASNSPWGSTDNPPGVAVGDASSPNAENLSVLLNAGVTISSGRIFFEPYALQGTKTLGGTFTAGSATINTYVHLLSSSINLQITDAPGGQFNLPLGILGGDAADITIVGGGTVDLGGLGAAQSEYFQGVTTVENGTLLLTGNDIVGNARDSYVLGNSSYTQAVQIGDSNTPVNASLSFLTGAAVTINHNISVNNEGGSIFVGGASANTSTFNSAIALAKNVTFSSVSGGVVNFNGNISGIGGITASGPGTINLSGANSFGGATNIAGGSNLVIAAAGALPSSDTIVNNGNLTFNGNSLAGNISGGGILNIGAASATVLKLANGTGGSSQGSLILSNNSTLDIANNHLIINYGANADPIATIRGYLVSGYNGGAWNGPGIDSSVLSGNPTYGLGYADGADGVVNGLFSGQLEIAFTLLGDANLDGIVSGQDFTILAANLGKSVNSWDQGDFNYDGVVGGDDFTALVSNLGRQANGADITLPASDYAAIDAFAAANGLMADVPEPASAGLLFAAGVGILARRRRVNSISTWR
ncbi:MAG TPA: autotransporter-associated beta strand repeat-containing protein, partial [Tepidisphaeraceae bacterium]